MRIGEAKQRDVGKKRARVGPEAMDFLKAQPGDIVEIMGSRTTCAIIWPVDEDEKFPDIIRIDGQTRKNVGGTLNDIVKIRKVTSKTAKSITTICKSQNCYMKSNKSVHIQNLEIKLDKLTTKDKKDIKTAVTLGCNWIALSYLQNEKLIYETRKLIKKDMGIISKIENKHALKNITKIIKSSVNVKSLLPEKIKNKQNNNLVDLTFKKAYGDITLGIALDEAFGFYYPDDLEKIINHGHKIKKVNLVKSKKLPALDALFIGGGFPETQASELAKNTSMKKSIKSAIENNLPVYADCGGLMYLANNLKYSSRTTKMSNVSDLDIKINSKPKKN